MVHALAFDPDHGQPVKVREAELFRVRFVTRQAAQFLSHPTWEEAEAQHLLMIEEVRKGNDQAVEVNDAT